MLKLSDKLTDNVKDDVWEIINSFHEIPSWTSEKHSLYKKIIDITTKYNYLKFSGDYRHYHMTIKGDSCLYDIPENQRGPLKVFAGKRIRLICTERLFDYGGSPLRVYLAKVIK